MTADQASHESYPVYDLIEEDFNRLLDESLEPRGPEMLFDLVDALALGSGTTVLDLGCGKGRHSIELARRFGVAVCGVDPDPSNLDRSRRELALNALPSGLGDLVRFEAGIAERIPLDDASVDLVWCRDVFTLVEDLDLAYAECRRVLRDEGHVIVYQMFATDRLEPREAAELYAALDCVPSSMDPVRTEAAIESAGLRLDETIILGTEWGEFFEEQSGKAARLLLHAGRLLRDPDRYIERFGRRNYEIKFGDCLWHIYRLAGKLSSRIYVLSPKQ